LLIEGYRIAGGWHLRTKKQAACRLPDSTVEMYFWGADNGSDTSKPLVIGITGNALTLPYGGS